MYINSLIFSHNTENFNNFFPHQRLYFDIETTGLQKTNAFVYLIGCAFCHGNHMWELRQWFAENPDEEAQILESFCQYASSFTEFCHFNGTRFDIPFLEFRCQQYQLVSPFSGKRSFDLYTQNRSLKNLLHLPGTKQKDFESFLQVSREDKISGKDAIKLYRKMIQSHDYSYRTPLLLHNSEDVQGLIQLEALQAYTELFKGNFRLASFDYDSNLLTATLTPSLGFPQPFDFLYKEWEIHASEKQMTVSVRFSDGFLKNYFKNYKDYFYMPLEDTAIHKSIGMFLDKSLKKQASKDTCYTKFLPDSSFLENFEQMELYLRQNIPVLLTLPSYS